MSGAYRGSGEAGDQRNPPDSEEPKATRNEEGKLNSHQKDDSKDERSIGNRLNAAPSLNEGDEPNKDYTEEAKLAQEDPTAPARAHGNEPSKGAKIDKNIADEEAEIIAKMDAKKQAQGKN